MFAHWLVGSLLAREISLVSSAVSADLITQRARDRTNPPVNRARDSDSLCRHPAADDRRAFPFSKSSLNGIYANTFCGGGSQIRGSLFTDRGSPWNENKSAY